MSVIRFWLSHRTELAGLLGQHVLLVTISTLVAVAIGVPLGVIAARRPRLSAPLVGLANIVQTVPSLAMFGFLLPVPLVGGVGARAALGFDDGKYEIAVYGRNILDNRDRVTALVLTGFGYIGDQNREPATYGIQATVKFGQ